MAEATCGYTIVDSEGDEQPCARLASGWRWYQGHFHEDMLDVACDLHENDGGRRIHDAEAEVQRLRKIVARVESLADVWGKHEPAEGMSPIRAHVALVTVLEGQ